jgi:hypothetical protein
MLREVYETLLTVTVNIFRSPSPHELQKTTKPVLKSSWGLAVGWLSILTIIHFLNGCNERTVKWKHNSHS